MSSTRHRVVIIDDTSDLRELLRLALHRGGFEVVGEAGDGRRGVEVVRETEPDIVLLDLSMPVVDGLDALPALRRAVPEATIIVLSGFGATQMSDRALANGADGYVQKGSSLDSVLAYLQDVVAGVPAATARSLTVAQPTAPDQVVLEGHHPAPSDHRHPAPTGGGAGGGAGDAWAEALDLAPVGVVELADEPLLRVLRINPVARRQLDGADVGSPLGFVNGPLATLVAYHRLSDDAAFEVDLGGTTARVVLRRSSHASLLVYLDSGQDDVAVLRRAIATAAHEIRGPVAVICGIAEASTWGGGSELDGETQARLMTSVSRQARILDGITADLLTTAQIQRGTLRLDPREVDVEATVRALVADRFGDEVEVVVEDDRRVVADPLRLEQMVTNLVGNALKYGQAPWSVHVRPEGALVAIDVVDHGRGVPEEFRAQLFAEFSRASGTVATGTGLGLYVVRGLAEAQGGRAGYEPGQYGGSVFTVALPAVTQA
ncbi:hybrid sensor histidine kinase/response regulator [Nocardioides bruguierae]|uniref:histidine kinase n=1 Tax=Nocardioides bruguierae TaxID=2945102 RepID=A0A9X2D749_9ACTN|nr:hybrid sensor histidine kinase/response regulator [Nocardioides bruguierae]MCM0620375.1 hybrid sensor histidine kinase/response regulator [Nocardioides bruguierae]